MKNRAELVTLMEILGALTEGQKFPTQLAQACNLNYNRLAPHIEKLEGLGFIKKESYGGHDLISIAPQGMEVWRQFEEIRARLKF